MVDSLIDQIRKNKKATTPLIDSIVSSAQAAAASNSVVVPRTLPQRQTGVNMGAIISTTTSGIVGPIIKRKYWGGL